MEFKFIIPLKTLSKKVGETWTIDPDSSNIIVDNLERTLQSISIAAENCSHEIDISAIISGHENPLIYFPVKQENIKIFFIENDFNRPQEKSQYMNDKERKKESAWKQIAKNWTEGSEPLEKLVMLMDADDLITKDFFDTVISYFKDTNCDDACLMSGYVFDYKNSSRGYLDGIEKIFYRNCGSSFISKLSKKDVQTQNSYIYQLKNHVKFPEIAKQHGRKVGEIFHPIACYLVNHGQNDASERHGPQHMVNFVRQYQCSQEKAQEFQIKFPYLM
ncbi:hypothetical protein [Stutzerimonas kunmingensis]|uniref:hypothetical protein n=1 Tax=Stutzerimonas kunmingensis TaxID=1211807 RepID=UPI00241FAA97|nr:hypothetical protein [Stutzerimonas kunmingensis]